MKPQGCRSFLNAWRTRVCVAIAAGAASLGSPVSAQEARAKAKAAPPAESRNAAAAVPERMPQAPAQLGRPVPMDLPSDLPTRIEPVSAPLKLPPVKELPTIADRQPPATAPQALTPMAVPESEKNMTLRERRNELRDMGLRDSTLRLFTEQVGAPPPPQSGTSWLGRPHSAPASNAPEMTDAQPGPLKRAFAKLAPPSGATEQMVEAPASSGVTQVSTYPAQATPPAAKTQSPGFLGRIFAGRPTAAEPMPRSVESMGITPISSAPTLRTP